jgi:DnaJ-class molecular chaperone
MLRNLLIKNRLLFRRSLWAEQPRNFFSEFAQNAKAKKSKTITLYDDLEIRNAATQREIKDSYNRLVKKYHPDVAGLDSTERFRQIQAAFNILRSPKKRRIYDDQLSESKKGKSPYEFSETSDEGFSNIREEDLGDFYKKTTSSKEFYRDMNRVFIKDIDLKAEYDKFMAQDIETDFGATRIYENQLIRQLSDTD